MSSGRDVWCHPCTIKHTHKYDWRKRPWIFHCQRMGSPAIHFYLPCALGQWQFNTRPVDVKEIKTEQTGPAQSKIFSRELAGAGAHMHWRQTNTVLFLSPMNLLWSKHQSKAHLLHHLKVPLRSLEGSSLISKCMRADPKKVYFLLINWFSRNHGYSLPLVWQCISPKPRF